MNGNLAQKTPFDWRSRLFAAGIHLGLSVLVASIAAVLVFGLWYPTPFREISGGRELFTLIVLVDVILGPLLTFAVFNRAKGAAQLRRDLAAVVVLQLSALGYGLHTVWVARPVYLVFEVDRFSVVRAIDVDPSRLTRAPENMRSFPIFGPRIIAAALPEDPEERLRSLDMALGGVDINLRPETWLSYSAARAQVLSRAKPLSELLAADPESRPVLNDAARRAGLPVESIGYLPIAAREMGWVALVSRRDAEVVGYLPFGGF